MDIDFNYHNDLTDREYHFNINKYIVHKPIYEFELIKDNILKALPEKEDLLEMSKKIIVFFKDGFDWKDLAKILNYSNELLDNFNKIPIYKKREYIITIMNLVIDITDTPYLPDIIFDPIFKIIGRQLVYLILPDSLDNKNIDHIQNLDDYKNILLNEFKNLTLHDIGSLTNKAITYTSKQNFSKDEKIIIAKQLVTYVIDKSTISYIQNNYTNQILKEISFGFIEELIN
jgi:hypothetical protein